MALTRLSEDQIQVPGVWDDSKSAGATLESGAVDLEDTIQSLISQLNNFNGKTNWYDAPTKTIETMAGYTPLEEKNILKRAQKIADIGPIAAGAQFTLLGTGEFPSHVVAIATSVKGAVTAQLAGAVGTAALTEIAGANALNPKNLQGIIDATTGDSILSGGRRVWGLLQVGVGASDNTAFAATGVQQGQITFVRPNATYDDLELVPSGDMDGKSIMYSYPFRDDMDSMSEQSFLPDALFADPGASATVTLDEAYNGGSVIAVDDTNVDWRLTDTKEFIVSDQSGSVKILTVKALSGGDVVQIIGTLDMDGDIDGGTNKGTWNSVEVGGAAGRISRTGGDLSMETLTSGNVRLDSVAEIQFTTSRETDIELDDATAGPISGLFGQSFGSISAAIKYAGEKGGVDLSVGAYAHSGGAIAAGTNVPGAAGTIDVTAPALDMNTPATVTTFVFFNGRLLFGGNVTVNNDVYPGTTPASGDLKFAFPIKAGDVVITLQLAE